MWGGGVLLSFRVYSSDFRNLLETYTKCIQNFPDWVNYEIYAYNNKRSLKSNTKGYGGQTRYNDSQSSDTVAPSGRSCNICSSRSSRPVR
jgi:hypothetical protein